MFRESSDAEIHLVADRPKGLSLKPFWPFLGETLAPYKWMVIAAFFILLFAAASLLTVGYGVRMLIDRSLGQEIALLHQALLILGAIVIAMSLASYGRLYIVSWITERVVADLRKRLFAHLIQLDFTAFETLSAGEVAARLTTDMTLLQIVVGTSLPIAVRNLMIMLGGICLLYLTSPFLTSLLIIIIPIVLVPMLLYGRRVRKFSRKTQIRLGELTDLIEETFSDMRSVHIFSRQRFLNQLFGEKVESALETSMLRVKARALLTALVMIIVFSAVGFFIWWGNRSVEKGYLTPGDLSSFIFYATVVAGATGSFSEIYTDLQRAAGATKRFLELLSQTSQITSPFSPIKLTLPVKGEIVFENVSFGYSSRPDHFVFKDLSLHIQPKEKVGFVGLSGEGKSTLFYLLLRLYDPSHGQVTLDGTPLPQLSLEELHSVIGVVPQEPLLIQGNIFDNIRFGAENIDEKEIIEATQKAQIFSFIQNLPEGFNTPLGIRGVRLSGGQKQRIALARALTRRPRLLLLDEATSSLDAESEYMIQEALKEALQECTALVIAHRLSTVQHMDRLILLNEGKVVSSGSHEQLMEKSALYRRLARLQFVDEKGG